MKISRSLVLVCLLPLLTQAQNQEMPPRSEAEILKTVKVPEGYQAKVYVKAPELGYPTAVAAAADGTLFVAVDLNGSLDRKPQRGKVVRVRDTNGDGVGDELKTFAEMDSPRGVIWDGATGSGPGTLYVMHPPNLTAYTDKNGDGVSDEAVDLVTGLGFGLDYRGADHTTNGCRLGIDGYIYVAVGDYGYVEAKGCDGTTIRNRGGGIVRVRPDGTGLEVVSTGQRNIYDVAISPTLDLFTRDNTNDGGGWNVRLSHVPVGAEMGYPRLFLNFPEDMLQPMADFGGGSPCGALWLDEPGLQNGLYMVEWGINALVYQPIQPLGAGWKVPQNAGKPAQELWLKMVRPTDADVDAAGNLYVTSWEGATFNYNGPNAGYVLKLWKEGRQAPKWSDPSKAALPELLKHLQSDSAVAREAAQRELVRRKPGAAVAEQLTQQAVTGPSLASRVAALETLKLTQGAAALPALVKLAKSPGLSANAFRALGEFTSEAAKIPAELLASGLKDSDARVRREAVTAVRRLKLANQAANLLPLVADGDNVVEHLAVRALSALKATDVCLQGVDGQNAKVQAGALRALYGIYELPAVDGLLARLPKASGELRRGVLNALCRLASQDELYVDPKVWWGTRPDTSGPVYKAVPWEGSSRIEAALKSVVQGQNEEEVKWLISRMYATKVPYPGLVELMLQRAGNDTKAKLTAVEGMLRPDGYLPPEASPVLRAIAQDAAGAPEARIQALRLLQKASTHPEVFTYAVEAFAPLAGQEISHPGLARAFEDFARDPKHSKKLNEWGKYAMGTEAAQRKLGQTVLLNVSTSKLVNAKEKEAATNRVNQAWAKPELAAGMLAAIAQTGATAYAEKVKALLNDPNNAVAEAALFAYQKLGLNHTAAAKPIGELKYDEVFAQVAKGGDVAQGKAIYLRAGCIACHTTSADEPPKGPVLSAVAKMYDRAALTESILKPNAKLAQGFESQWFRTSKGEQLEGFVTREGGDSLDVRNVAGQTVTLEKGDIAERGKREHSMMPEGLLNSFTPAELAALLAYLESLKGN